MTSNVLPIATIRTTPEDFIVDEIPAYPASGKGEHLFITLRKTNRNTMDVARELARCFGADQRGVGYAGMKDRHAITTQTISLPVPMAVDYEPILAKLALPCVEILEAKRHDNKLKPGHLDGNRFSLKLRCTSVEDALSIRAKLEETARLGAPNLFGPQRFGRDGNNPTRALAWLGGTERGPRDRHEQRLLFSALQSLLFNQVLEKRMADGTWTQVLPGDLAKKHDSGGLFLVANEGPELDDAKARATSLAISATGPMFGAKMRWPEGAVKDLEMDVLTKVMPDLTRLEDFRKTARQSSPTSRKNFADLVLQKQHKFQALSFGRTLLGRSTSSAGLTNNRIANHSERKRVLWSSRAPRCSSWRSSWFYQLLAATTTAILLLHLAALLQQTNLRPQNSFVLPTTQTFFLKWLRPS